MYIHIIKRSPPQSSDPKCLNLEPSLGLATGTLCTFKGYSHDFCQQQSQVTMVTEVLLTCFAGQGAGEVTYHLRGHDL